MFENKIDIVINLINELNYAEEIIQFFEALFERLNEENEDFVKDLIGNLNNKYLL